MDELENLRQEKERLQLKKEIAALKKYDIVLFVVFFLMFVLGLGMTGSVQMKDDYWFSIGKLIAGPLWCMPFLITLLKR